MTEQRGDNVLRERGTSGNGAAERMDAIELSFCIPTYNRAENVHRLVTGILSNPDPTIEVVVLDNGSTDDTVSMLRAIDDTRLAVYGNGENRGALFNMVNVLDRGRGAFLVYCTDRDYVDADRIGEFISFLKHAPGLACGFCTYHAPPGPAYELYPKGYAAVKHIAYRSHHPTGYFFNNGFLKSVRLVDRFSDYDFVDLFPLEFAFAELCLMGDGAIYHRPVFRPETGANVVRQKSSTTNGRSATAFFLPEVRLKLAINYVKHLSTLPLGAREKNRLIADIFVNELTISTLGYRSILGNRDLCAHYFMEPRDVAVGELVRIGRTFYRTFVNETAQYIGNGFPGRCTFLCRSLGILVGNRLKKYVNVRASSDKRPDPV